MMLEVHIEVLSHCNMACIHCSSALGKYEEGINQSVSNVINAIKGCDTSSGIRIFMTGGEPLNYPDLYTSAAGIADCPRVMGVGLFTSGCRLSSLGKICSVNISDAKSMVEYGIKYGYVSLYSPRAKQHDHITGINGSYDCAIGTIRNLLIAGIDVRVNTPVMKLNADCLLDLVDCAALLGVTELRLLRLVKHGRATSNWRQIGLNRNEQKMIITNILKSKSSLVKEMAVTVAGFPELSSCRPFELGNGCQAGIRLFYIDVYGNVFPCACMKHDRRSSIFNINSEPDGFERYRKQTDYMDRCLQDI